MDEIDKAPIRRPSLLTPIFMWLLAMAPLAVPVARAQDTGPDAPLTDGELCSAGAELEIAADDAGSSGPAAPWVAVHSAAIRGDRGRLEIQIESDDGSWRNHPQILVDSVATGRTDIIEMLLMHGADPDLAVPGGVTPLIVSAQCNRPEAMALLIRFGADVNVKSSSGIDPMIAAIMARSRAAVEMLLEHGFDLSSSRTPNGLTPAVLAIRTDQPEMALMIMQSESRSIP